MRARVLSGLGIGLHKILPLPILYGVMACKNGVGRASYIAQ